MPDFSTILPKPAQIPGLAFRQARGEQLVWLDTFAEYQTRAVDLFTKLGFSVVKEF